MSTPAVGFLPPFADRFSRISLYLVPKMYIVPGETITLWLPPLIGNSSTFFASFLLSSTVVPWNATWAGEGVNRLTLTSASYVAPDEQVQVITPLEANLFIPATGIEANDASMELWSNAANGPVPPTKLSSSQGVSNVRVSNVTFSPTRFGTSTNVTITGGFALDLSLGDHLLVELPGFGGDHAAQVALHGPFADMFEVTWSIVDRAVFLQLTMRRGAVPSSV